MREETGAEAKAECESGTVTHELAARLEGGGDRRTGLDINQEDRDELEALLRLADHLDRRMKPVRPAPAFVQSLGEELVREAESRMRRRERRHRIAVISAAVAGGIVSVASLVGGIVVLVKWLRTRGGARQVSAA